MSNLSSADERTLQRGVHRLLSDPSRVWRTASGKLFQVLSPGTPNRHEGPDFLTTALFIDGEVLIGDAEFHRNASDWQAHNHTADMRYANVILHIIMRDNAAAPDGVETLVLGIEVIEAAETLPHHSPQDDGLELQHFALLRMLRRTAECAGLLRQHQPVPAFVEYANHFFASLAKKRRRPAHTEAEFNQMAAALPASAMAAQIINAAKNDAADFQTVMTAVLRQKISTEGGNLRREIAINCFLPMMLALADDKLRTQIFLWYWSAHSLGEYGVLARRFPDTSQRYFWQQQGMLEYIREHGERGNIASEAILRYGFAEALNFYKHAASPVADDIIILSDNAENFAETDDEE